MTDKLSKQICEKCGISYYEDYLPSCGEDVLEDSKILDFGEPSNFIKLLEMITSIEGFMFETGTDFFSPISSSRRCSTLIGSNEAYPTNEHNLIKAFLKCVLELITNDKDTTEYIREAEWKYE